MNIVDYFRIDLEITRKTDADGRKADSIVLNTAAAERS